MLALCLVGHRGLSKPVTPCKPDCGWIPTFVVGGLIAMRVANGKARRVLGWAPRFPSFREGLRAILEGGN